VRDKEKKEKYDRKYRKEHRDAFNQYRKAWRTKDKVQAAMQEYHRYRRYHLTLEQLSKLIRQQKVCPICGVGLKDLELRNVCVDHNHTTGKLRGILCRKCNIVLGMAGDRVDVLKAAVHYLEEGGTL
jgi:hypothetical protein